MTKWVVLPLCLWAAACGDDGDNGHLADAPVLDAVDPLPVTVTVTVGGKPSANQTVYFQSKDSATTITRQTDASGNASAIIEAGGFATVIEPPPDLPPPSVAPLAGLTNLSTFAAVQPGDHLHVDVAGITDAAGITITGSVPNEGNGYDYYLYTSCGSGFIGTGNGQLTAKAAGLARRAKQPARLQAGAQLLANVTGAVSLSGCNGTADILAIGQDSDHIVRSWAYKANVAVAENTSVTFDAWQQPATMSFAYTVASGNRVDVTRDLYTARGRLYRVEASAFDENQHPSTSLPVPNPAGVSALTISTDNPFDGVAQHRVIEWGQNTDYELDVTGVSLHPFQSRADVDAANHKLTWQEDTTGKTPDFTIGAYEMQRNFADDTSASWNWRIMAPYAAGAITYPVLPTTVFDFNPKADDSVLDARIITVRTPGGYNAARNARVFGEFLGTFNDFFSFDGSVVDASGQIVYEQYFFAGSLTKARRSLSRAAR